MPGGEVEDLLDAGGDRLGHHLEVLGVILLGDNSIGEFYSVALTNLRQQADTGTKMIHIGKNTKSTIVSKGISAGRGQNTYRGLVRVNKGATGRANYSQCDSLLLGDKCGATPSPTSRSATRRRRWSTRPRPRRSAKTGLFYCRQRGISTEDAVSMIVNGFCKQVFRELPMEFAGPRFPVTWRPWAHRIRGSSARHRRADA